MGKRRQFWDCPYCEMKGIKRKHKTCPNCGSPRPHKTKFYQPEIILSIADERRYDPDDDGSDWTCPYCGAGNPNEANLCSACQAQRETRPEYQIADISLKKRPKREKKPIRMYDRYKKQKQRKAAKAKPEIPAEDPEQDIKPKGFPLWLKLAGVLGALLVAGLAIAVMVLIFS